MRFKLTKLASDRTHDHTEINYEFTGSEIDEIMEHISAFLRACGFEFVVETEDDSNNSSHN
jgi:hypothetical protein